MTDGLRYDVSPLGSGDNWVNRVGGLPTFARAIAHALIRDGHSESEAVQMAIGVLKNWASGKGHVKPATRARAAAAVAEWEAKRAAAHSAGHRSTVTEDSSAGALLPVGPTMTQSKAIRAKELHAFRGSNPKKCTLCDHPATAAIHRGKKASGARSDFADHPMAVKAPKDAVVHRLQAHKQFIVDADSIEPQFEDAMKQLFERQRTGTLSRLTGKRGKRMLSGNRADPEDGEGAAGSSSSTPDVNNIFDATFWTAETAKAAAPIYDIAQNTGVGHVQQQLGATLPEAEKTETGSLDAVTSIIRSRAKRMADEVTQTTHDRIQNTLAEGVDKGESIAQLGDRVKHVFDVAGTSRARMIARTETIGAMNQAAYTYADNLPVQVVGSRSWLAHHDGRTRPTHVVAGATQIKVPMGQPYIVGGSPMMFPGDPDAPPDEVIGCRCSQAFFPSEMAVGRSKGVAA